MLILLMRSLSSDGGMICDHTPGSIKYDSTVALMKQISFWFVLIHLFVLSGEPQVQTRVTFFSWFSSAKVTGIQFTHDRMEALLKIGHFFYQNWTRQMTQRCRLRHKGRSDKQGLISQSWYTGNQSVGKRQKAGYGHTLHLQEIKAGMRRH